MADILAICEKETIFVQILADYLRKKYKTHLEIMAFDNADKFLSFLREKKIFMCLLGEEMIEESNAVLLHSQIKHLIYVSGKRKKDRIFKYQSVEGVANDFLNMCVENEIYFLKERTLVRRDQIKIIGFYAPAHHLMQSTLAITMGQMMARKQKVLYLNFEPYSAFDYLLQKSFEHDLMDVFFFLREEKEKFRLKFERMLEHMGNLDYVPPVFCYPDMEDVDVTLWQRLLDRIIEDMEYDVLILDMSEHTRGLFSMLEMCDEIYTCLPDDGIALAKADQYERLLVHMKKERILAHTRKSIVPTFHNVPLSDEMFTNSEIIRYVKSLQKEKLWKKGEDSQNEGI